MKISRFEEIERKIEEVVAERNKLLGRKEALMDKLKKYNFESITGASKYVEKQSALLIKEREELDARFKDFEIKYKDLL